MRMMSFTTGINPDVQGPAYLDPSLSGANNSGIERPKYESYHIDSGVFERSQGGPRGDFSYIRGSVDGRPMINHVRNSSGSFINVGYASPGPYNKQFTVTEPYEMQYYKKRAINNWRIFTERIIALEKFKIQKRIERYAQEESDDDLSQQ